MKALAIILSIILFIICLVLVAVVLLQDGKDAGLGALAGGSAESYFGKNKVRTLEGKLSLITKILGGAFFVLALVLYFILASL